MAHQLGVTLDTIYNMSSKEYMGWIQYFKERPYGWREDHRAAVLTQTTYQGKTKIKIDDLFPALGLMKEEAKKDKDPNQAPFFNRLKAIANKNKIDFLKEDK